MLEAGFERRSGRALLLVHGYPELAYSWRKVMPPLAAAGYHVFAPDLRGYGRTSGTDVTFDDDLAPFRTLNEVRDMLSLVSALGYRSVDGVIGHDFGSPVSAWCAVSRPDVFRSVVLMSAPFGGTPSLPFNTADQPRDRARAGGRHDLRRARTAEAAAQALSAVLRHARSERQHVEGDGGRARLPARLLPHEERGLETEQPVPVEGAHGGRVGEDAALLHHGPRQGHGRDGRRGNADAAEIAANRWLPDNDLRVYTEEYGRTGFQGGLQGYRGGGSRYATEVQLFAGRTIDQPSMFIAGRSDWGAYQNPGALERMQKTACTRMLGVHFVDGAGHWVQQEQPEATTKLLLEFLKLGIKN